MLMLNRKSERQTDSIEQLSDTELLRLIVLRDQAAGSELFDRHSGEIYGFLRSQFNASDSEDLLQEIFARALRGASRFRGQSEVRTWLRSIARYTVSERFRAPAPAHTLPDNLSGGPGPESIAIRREQLHEMISALERLPDEQAIVLELHRVDGLSHQQIARTLGIKPATSRKRLERALENLHRGPNTVHGAPGRHTGLESWRSSLLRRLLPTEN